MKTQKAKGRLVAQLRKLIGKSQSQFAAMIGVSKHTIISVENGRNTLSKNLARRIQIATGAKMLEGHFRFQPEFNLPSSEEPNTRIPEVQAFLRQRWDGTGRRDETYSREDFEQWRRNFFPSDDKAARRSFNKLKMWVELIFRAAAKPGAAGNRNRLPAVYQSLVEWLDEALEHFKLGDEIDQILEDETHSIGEHGYAISALKASKNPDEFRREFAQLGHDFDEIRKHFKKAKPGDWLVLETEMRSVWDPFDDSQQVPCKIRKLLPKPKFRIVDGREFVGEKLGISRESAMQQLQGLER